MLSEDLWVKLISNSPDETEAIGFRLGKMLKAGDIVGLYGDLGTGKTTMVKGLATASGIDRRDVTSASFTIIAEYRSNPPLYHIDLYRIEKDGDLDSTGIWDCLGKNSISVIEWAEKLGDELPEGLIKVRIDDKGNGIREISIEGIHEEDRHNL
jgi:tRNA threonylcarbamoyladenosine biosynthesis protein TsaE